jgi:hypothetical protein
MMDRAQELAEAIMADPWVDDRLRKICRGLLKQWAKEDTNRNKAFANPEQSNEP